MKTGLITKLENAIEWYKWFSFYMKSEKRERLGLREPQAEPIHVVMNGPSLKNSIHLIKEFPGKVLMVNSAISHLEDFENIKPNYYCLVDPLYAEPTEGVADWISSTWESLEQYKASLELFLPSAWKKNVCLKNPNVHIRYVMSVPVPHGKGMYEKLRKNVAVPAFHGVVIMGLYVALQLGYKKIYLHGADHDSFKGLFINENNEMCMKYAHIYDEGREVNLAAEGGCSMLSGFYDGVHLYESFYLLEDYSKMCGAKIINMSQNSMVDCFTRYHYETIQESTSITRFK